MHNDKRCAAFPRTRLRFAADNLRLALIVHNLTRFVYEEVVLSPTRLPEASVRRVVNRGHRAADCTDPRFQTVTTQMSMACTSPSFQEPYPVKKRCLFERKAKDKTALLNLQVFLLSIVPLKTSARQNVRFARLLAKEPLQSCEPPDSPKEYVALMHAASRPTRRRRLMHQRFDCNFARF